MKVYQLILAALLNSPRVFAVSPHFVSAGAKCVDEDLQVCFKEAGLGTNQLINVELSALETSTTTCPNRGAKNQKPPGLTESTTPQSQPGEFNSGKNGQINSCLTIRCLPAGDCPPGTNQVNTCSYSSITLTDTTNGVEEDLPNLSC